MLENTLKTKSNNSVPNAAIGGMKWTSNVYGKVDLNQAKKTLLFALEHGYIHIDTADCYLGSDGNPHNETFIGEELQNLCEKGLLIRDDLFIATKCGIKLDSADAWKREIDISPVYISNALENSLKRLKLQHVDLLYLHRISEEKTSIEKSMQAMHFLRENGKIRYIGLSEAGTEIIKRANDELRRLSNGQRGLDAIQTEYNLLSRSPETNGVFATCSQLGINFFAYSPLSRGLTSGNHIDITIKDCRSGLERFNGENLHHNQQIIRHLTPICDRLNCSMAQLSLSWMKHQARSLGIALLPVFGTANPKHLLENIEALSIKLQDEDLALINSIIPIGTARGLRYPKEDMLEFSLS